jgi:hypothetical protein
MALHAVRECLRRDENQPGWDDLSTRFATNRLELFDMVWWAVTRAGGAQENEHGLCQMRVQNS